MLVFGLGAAALLRAAHQEFAGIPSRRAPPETMFAQRDAGPALAMLRIEPSASDQKAATATVLDNVQDQPAIVSTPPEPELAAEPDKIAALTDAATPVENPPSSDAPSRKRRHPKSPFRLKRRLRPTQLRPPSRRNSLRWPKRPPRRSSPLRLRPIRQPSTTAPELRKPGLPRSAARL
jgi:hypothetical protein